MVNVNLVISVIIIAFLSLVILNHFLKDLFKLNPFYRNNVLLEGFDSVVDASGNAIDASGNAIDASNVDASNVDASNADASNADASNADASTNVVPTSNVEPTLIQSSTASPSTDSPSTASASPTPQLEDTDKSTIMADLFEKVNSQMDIIRTLKLSDKFIPINIDKTVSDPFVIIMNLKLLINNSVYKNELDLKEMYDKYIGNKAVQLLISDINSVNMDSSDNSNIGSLETTFLTRCQTIVNGHQKIIDKILENKSNE